MDRRKVSLIMKSSSKYWCVVPGCKSDTRKKTNLQKYPWKENVTFKPFPTKLKDHRLRSKWIEMIRRPLGYLPLPHHRVCSRHFCSSDFRIPELFPWNNYKENIPTRAILNRQNGISSEHTVSITATEDPPACNSALDDTMDSNNNKVSGQRPIEDCSSFLLMVSDGDHNRLVPVVKFVIVTTTEDELCSDPSDVSCPLLIEHSYSNASASTTGTNRATTNAAVQTDMTLSDIDKILIDNKNLKEKLDDKDTLFKNIFIEKVTKSDESVRKYTGLPNLEIFNSIKNIAVNYDSNMKYWTGGESEEEKRYQNQGKKPGPSRKLSRTDEFILTLVRLRLALPVLVMSDLFGVSCSRISSVFTTWIFCLYYIFRDCIIWPSRELIKKFMPKSFQQSFPRTRAIIDCSEIFIQRPRNPTVNARTYSSYKSHNNFKFLVSITPTGAFNFISQIWGGNTSDRYITMHSGFLDLVSQGDEIMADRGFTIRDLLTERRAYLTIPPFTRKCTWGKGKFLSVINIRKTRKIANLRIHVERAIQRLKTFKLVSQTIPWNMKSLVHPMVTVAAFFCNLKRPLVKSK